MQEIILKYLHEYAGMNKYLFTLSSFLALWFYVLHTKLFSYSYLQDVNCKDTLQYFVIDYYVDR